MVRVRERAWVRLTKFSMEEVLTALCEKKTKKTKKQLALVRRKKVAVDYGFPWDTNSGLFGRSP